MKFTRKTYYALGLVSAALNILSGVMLIFGTAATLPVHIATVAGGAMMLLLAATEHEDKKARMFCLSGALLTVLGLVPGAAGKICAAVSWPVFAWLYFSRSEAEDAVHKMSFLVMLSGLVLLVGSFLPMPQMLAACIMIAIAAAEGVFVWLLYRQEAEKYE